MQYSGNIWVGRSQRNSDGVLPVAAVRFQRRGSAPELGVSRPLFVGLLNHFQVGLGRLTERLQ